MAEKVMALAISADDLSSTLRTQVERRTNSHKLFYDCHMHAVTFEHSSAACMRANTDTHTHTQQCNIFSPEYTKNIESLYIFKS